MGKILDGKLVSQEIKGKLKEEVAALAGKGLRPGLAAVLVGDYLPSAVYVRTKRKACEVAGIASFEYKLPEATTEAELIRLVSQLNEDEKVHGILIQLPLPTHIDSDKVLSAMTPSKDVDGLHPMNLGRLLKGSPLFLPCTPHGILTLLDYYHLPVEGRQAVVVGRSILVGKPAALLLMQRNATVTICHTRTKDIGDICRRADILVVAIGRARAVTADMVREGAVVVDVGINRLSDGRLVGDVDYEAVEKKAAWITPVPGGVGPMTVAMLLQNTLDAATRQAGLA